MHPFFTHLSLGLSVTAVSLQLSATQPPSPLSPSLPTAIQTANPDFLKAQSQYPRVRQAFARQEPGLKAAFGQVGAQWPPQKILLRAYKHEGELELWAPADDGSSEPRLVERFEICAASGVLGPKRRQGDLQVPEGIYYIDRFNPASRFHLSLGINYPSDEDRARSPGEDPGSDIFIHGGCVTVGCLPIEDAGIETLYVATTLAHAYGQDRIPVQILPCRFGEPQCVEAMAPSLQAQPALKAFWLTLEQRVQAPNPELKL